jgi:[protein-PII] uridylyltransferase
VHDGASGAAADRAAATGLAAEGLAGSLGSSVADVRVHLARMPEGYAAAVPARAIVRHALMTATVPAPTEIRTRVTPGDPSLLVEDERGPREVDELDVVALDAPGWFAKVAGVIALQGGSVLAAEAFTRDDGVLVDTFVVERPEGATSSWWARVEGDLVEAAEGRLAVRARVARRAEADQGRVDRLAPVATSVATSVEPGADTAVLEVRTIDRIGVLYAITSAVAELQLDVVDAVVQTVGPEVVDRFRLRDHRGRAPDADHRAELELAVTAAIAGLGARTVV